MATDIYMPLMGLTMSEGTVVRWLKSTGNPVKKGEAVLEIETDKATVEIEAPSDGVIGPILVAEGKTVPVGTILSHVLSSAEYGARSSASCARSSMTEASCAGNPRSRKMLPLDLLMRFAMLYSSFSITLASR